jgi:hypothetical protein
MRPRRLFGILRASTAIGVTAHPLRNHDMPNTASHRLGATNAAHEAIRRPEGRRAGHKALAPVAMRRDESTTSYKSMRFYYQSVLARLERQFSSLARPDPDRASLCATTDQNSLIFINTRSTTRVTSSHARFGLYLFARP